MLQDQRPIGPAGLLLSHLLYILVLEPLLHRLRDEKANPTLHGVPFASRVRAKVSGYADDITVFLSRYLNILAVKKAVEKYKEVADGKINFDKSEGLRLDARRGSVPLPGSFRWSDVRAKVEAQVGTWLRR